MKDHMEKAIKHLRKLNLRELDAVTVYLTGWRTQLREQERLKTLNSHSARLTGFELFNQYMQAKLDSEKSAKRTGDPQYKAKRAFAKRLSK